MERNVAGCILDIDICGILEKQLDQEWRPYSEMKWCTAAITHTCHIGSRGKQSFRTGNGSYFVIERSICYCEVKWLKADLVPRMNRKSSLEQRL